MGWWSRLAVSALIASALTSCGSGNPGADAALEVAKRLHEVPMAGFTYSEVMGPDVGIDYSNPSSSFTATPASGQLTEADCAAVVDWVSRNLKDVLTGLQYSTASRGQELLACKTAMYGLMKNATPGLFYLGYVGRTPVYVSFEGSTIGQFTVSVEGDMEYFDPEGPGNEDLAKGIQQLLNALAAFRAEQQLTDFSPAQFDGFWSGYQASTGTKTTITYEPDSDGKVRRVTIEEEGGFLLPLCMSIAPFNTDLLGADPGPDYLFVLGDSFEGDSSFGFGVGGPCSK